MIKRLTDLEKYARTHGESISTVTKVAEDHERRLAYLEQLAQSRAITEAREDERDKALYKRLDGVDTEIASLRVETTKEFNAIKGVGSKALWVFFSAIILAVAAFVIRGGFAP